LLDVYPSAVYLDATATEKPKGNGVLIMEALWILATFAFVFTVLATVGFGFARMFFVAGAAR
jgi:hypothetical protein